MNQLTLLLIVLFAINTTAKTNNNLNEFNSEKSELEKILFVNIEDSSFEYVDINSIEVIELEEEVELEFNPKDYLPENFNALKVKHDLDWSTIELIELEEEVGFNFNPKDYLPEGFNALKGMHDLDSHKIQLVLIEDRKSVV